MAEFSSIKLVSKRFLGLVVYNAYDSSWVELTCSFYFLETSGIVGIICWELQFEKSEIVLHTLFKY
jgi:hypothetical protein